LAGYAPVAGVYGTSLATATCGGLLLRAMTGPKRALPLVLLAALLGAGAALRTVEWTQPYGAPVTASLLQGNIAQETKFDPERFERTFAAYERLAAGSRAKLVVLPETALPRFLDRIDPAHLAALDAIAKRNGGDLLLGVPYRTGQDRYFNSVVSLGVSPPQIYSKSHLVPFGEFILPGFGWIVNVLHVPMSEFSRGDAVQAPLAVAGQQVAVNICYEDAFGEELIGPLPAATLLVNVSNMAWFGDTLAPGQHLQMARMRTIETGRAMLAATNTGMTAAIDRGGRVIAQLPQYKEDRLDVEVRGYSGATPYVRFGNWPALLAAALLVALSAALRKR
jgi:apolipoprotein N-acyltransferase